MANANRGDRTLTLRRGGARGAEAVLTLPADLAANVRAYRPAYRAGAQSTRPVIESELGTGTTVSIRLPRA